MAETKLINTTCFARINTDGVISSKEVSVLRALEIVRCNRGLYREGPEYGGHFQTVSKMYKYHNEEKGIVLTVTEVWE